MRDTQQKVFTRSLEVNTGVLWPQAKEHPEEEIGNSLGAAKSVALLVLILFLINDGPLAPNL